MSPMSLLASVVRQHVRLRCPGQATFWVTNTSCNPFLQLQQLHTAATAAAAAHTAGAHLSSSDTHGQANATDQLQPVQQPEVVTSLLTGLRSKQLDSQHVGLYYDFDKALLPEAFQAFHQAFYSPRPSQYMRKGGCRALQAEFRLSHSSSLMWRRSSQELQQALSSRAVPHIHLRGSPGAGKSIAVAQMVEWARSNGWIALYVPSAGALTHGGFFSRRGDTDTYDTIISAQHILKSMADSHTAQLSKLQLQRPESRSLLQLPAVHDSSSSSSSSSVANSSGAQPPPPAAAEGGKEGGKKGKKGPTAADVQGTLMQLVVAGLSTDEDGRLAVEACLALVKELAAVADTHPVLLAVDDYNALYWTTEYGRTVFVSPENGPDYQYRQPLDVTQLNLARSMRLLERSDLGSCRVLVADSASNRVPPHVAVPSGSAGVYHMPRFSEVETAHALHYFYERGLTAEPPTARQVSAMRALTNGSGADLRQWCLKVTQTDMGLL